MKKNLPLILIGIGLIVVTLAVFVVIKSFRTNVAPNADEEEVVLELPQNQWPVVYIVPTSDPAIPNSLGHLLSLNVQNINVPGADTLDYLLVYNTSNGGQQGVPGTIQLTGTNVSKNLLLGSESSGKYRFDNGVTQGEITLNFRNKDKKNLGKLKADFHFQSDDAVLTSLDGKFTYTLDKAAKGVYFVTMPTFVQPSDPNSYVVWQNGYGVFASDGKEYPGSVAQ